MIPSWAGAYIDIPWREKGRDHDGADCWGLMRLVMRERFGVTLPSYDEDYATVGERELIAALLTDGIPECGWTPAERPYREGDGVVFRLLGGPWHVGVMLDDDFFLHADQDAGVSCIGRISAARWARRIYGVFRLAVITP